ncbi:hypothetical protein [Rhodovulum sp. YNF3179]|uniref:hypothetical protein n=1 Tax=Rhodovulum sp. YNF3179 TaxID=3425127 RepID=UPI003D34AF6A
MPAALERFYARLAAEGRAPEQVRAEDFAAVSASRTAFRTLMTALARFAPDVPTAAARPVKEEWDRWLNSRYNAKPRKPPRSRRVALAPEDWPERWQAALPRLEQRVRRGEERYRPLAPTSRDSVIQAVGMCATARRAAMETGTALGDSFSPELAEAFLAFMLERENPKTGGPVSYRTIADYMERIASFAIRGGLMTTDGAETFSEITAACREEQALETPAKHGKVRAFMAKHGLDSILGAALAAKEEADKLPAHSAAALRLRRKAVIFAMLVNGADRQGDLSGFRIGHEIKRHPDGLWEPAFRQAKTGLWKENGPLLHLTSLLIDAHILEGRPAWCLGERLRALDGCNLISLTLEPMSTYYPSALLKEEFGISGHLLRTLITNLLRQERPDAAWAVQKLLGHSSRYMQETYRTEFAETAAIGKYHAALADMVKAA